MISHYFSFSTNITSKGITCCFFVSVVSVPQFQETDDEVSMAGHTALAVIGKKKDGSDTAKAEPFVDYNWNLINPEIIRIPPNKNKVVKLVMAGTPRIKRMAKLELWGSKVRVI